MFPIDPVICRVDACKTYLATIFVLIHRIGYFPLHYVIANVSGRTYLDPTALFTYLDAEVVGMSLNKELVPHKNFGTWKKSYWRFIQKEIRLDMKQTLLANWIWGCTRLNNVVCKNINNSLDIFIASSNCSSPQKSKRIAAAYRYWQKHKKVTRYVLIDDFLIYGYAAYAADQILRKRIYPLLTPEALADYFGLTNYFYPRPHYVL